MKKNYLLLILALCVSVSSFAVNEILSFDDLSAHAFMKYTGISSQSSANPITVRIENWDNYSMYRFFEGGQDPTEGGFPTLGEEWVGIRIEFDYADKSEIPDDIQLFFSATGFADGSYPWIVDLLDPESDDPVVVAMFEDFEHLSSQDAGTPFNRFGIRFGTGAGTKIDPDGPGTSDNFENYSIVDVKIKESVLLKSDGSEAHFTYVGGGMYNAAHSFRLYGESVEFILEADGFVSWDLSDKDVKFINISLGAPLTEDVIDNLVIEYAEFEEVDSDKISGFEEGSTFISLDLTDVDVEEFTLFTEEDITLNIKKIALSATAEDGIDKIFANEEVPAFVNVHSITGQLIKQNVARESALDGLMNGVYLINNKKIILNR